MLVVENLTKRFGRNTAVDSMNFSVDRPMMLGIIGRSGAGKSTFLRMMNRMTDATQGSLTFDGRDVLTLVSTRGQCPILGLITPYSNGGSVED